MCDGRSQGGKAGAFERRWSMRRHLILASASLLALQEFSQRPEFSGRESADRSFLNRGGRGGRCDLVKLSRVRLNRSWGTIVYRLGLYSLTPEYVELVGSYVNWRCGEVRRCDGGGYYGAENS